MLQTAAGLSNAREQLISWAPLLSSPPAPARAVPCRAVPCRAVPNIILRTSFALFFSEFFVLQNINTPTSSGRIFVGRPPATPKPPADDLNSSGSNLGSGRILPKRVGGCSTELHSITADAGPASAAASGASSTANSTPGTAGATMDSSDSLSAGSGYVLWSAEPLARGGNSGGRFGGSSKSFTPVTPQDGGRQVPRPIIFLF